MHELADEMIVKRAGSVIDEWDFEKRSKANPEECMCYSQGQKCHDIEELNCFFCYCPNYNKNVKEGACKINSPQGKYIDGPSGKILDCSGCDFPHKRENAIKLLDKLFK